MSSPGIVYPFRGDRLVQYLGTNMTVDDLLASSTDATSGTIWYSATGLSMISASTGAVLARNATGDISYNRTAAGAETHYAVCQPELPLSTAASKGLKLTGFRMAYTLGVVDATSVTPAVNMTVYANAVANAVTQPFGTLTYDAAHNSAALRKSSTGGVNPHLMVVNWPNTSFLTALNTLVSVEVAFVLASTGTLAVSGYGFDFTFNYHGA